MKKVSILMTTYNDEGRFLNEAIESILNQSYKNFEFIIVNDGSTDKTSEIITKYSNSDTRIQFIDRKENFGRVRSLNEGLQYVSTDYLFINDADDISVNYRIEEMMKFIHNSDFDTIAMVGSASNFYYPNDNKYVRKNPLPFSAKNNEVRKWRIVLSLPFAHSSTVYNVKYLTQLGGFPSDVKYDEDYFICCKFVASGYKIYMLDNCLVTRVFDNQNFFYGARKKDERISDLKYIHQWNLDNFRFYRYYYFLSKLIIYISNLKKNIVVFKKSNGFRFIKR